MRAAVLSFLGAVAAIEAHRFPEEEPTYYCHPEIEWDSVPPREDDSGAQLVGSHMMMSESPSLDFIVFRSVFWCLPVMALECPCMT